MANGSASDSKDGTPNSTQSMPNASAHEEGSSSSKLGGTAKLLAADENKGSPTADAGKSSASAPSSQRTAPHDGTADGAASRTSGNAGEGNAGSAGKGKPARPEVADQAKAAASSVAAAASDKAQRVVSEATDEFEHMFEERKQEGAQQLHRFADAVSRASSELQEGFPLLARYVKRGASKVDTFAEAIKERDGRTLAAEASDLVRRRTGMVAGVLGLVGFAAIRFLKATPPQIGSGDSGGTDGASRGTSEPVQRALLRSAATGEGIGSGDPGGTSPVAPGFETATETSGATRGLS